MTRITLGLCMIAGVALADAPDKVKLLDPGAKPHQILELQPHLRLRSTLRIEVTQSVTQQTGERIDKTKMPKVHFEGELHLQPSSDKALQYTITFTSIRVVRVKGMEKGTNRALQSKWKDLIGMTYKAHVTRQGYLLDAKLTLPKRPDPAIKTPLQSFQQTLRLIHTPFPAEPVGVGARWENKSIVNLNGVVMERRQAWTLKRIGKTLVVGSTSTEKANPKSVDLGTLPDGMKAEVSKVGGTASTSVKLRLNHLLPISWEQQLKHHLHLSGQIGESTFETKTSVDASMRLIRNPKK